MSTETTDNWDDWDDIVLDEEEEETDDNLDDGNADEEGDNEAPNDTDPEDSETIDEGEQAESQENTETFELVHLGEKFSKTKEEMTALAQKGMDYDRVKESVAQLKAEKTTLAKDNTNLKEQYEAILDAQTMLDELATESGYKDTPSFIEALKASSVSKRDGIDAKLALEKVKLEKREKDLKKREAKLSEKPKEADTKETDKGKNDDERKKHFADFVKAYPDIKPKDVPNEVWTEYAKGGDLVSAYVKYENKQLKERLKAVEKGEDNAQRSTGSRKGVAKKSAKQQAFDDAWYND